MLFKTSTKRKSISVFCDSDNKKKATKRNGEKPSKFACVGNANKQISWCFCLIRRTISGSEEKWVDTAIYSYLINYVKIIFFSDLSDEWYHTMTIVLDVSFNDQSDSQNSAINEISRKKAKHNACSSKVAKVAKVKNKVRIVGITWYILSAMSAINCNRELRNVLL